MTNKASNEVSKAREARDRLLRDSWTLRTLKLKRRLKIYMGNKIKGLLEVHFLARNICNHESIESFNFLMSGRALRNNRGFGPRKK